MFFSGCLEASQGSLNLAQSVVARCHTQEYVQKTDINLQRRLSLRTYVRAYVTQSVLAGSLHSSLLLLLQPRDQLILRHSTAPEIAITPCVASSSNHSSFKVGPAALVRQARHVFASTKALQGPDDVG